MKRHFDEILKTQDDWLVCEKSDGTRYLMLVLNNGHVYLTGRNVGGTEIFIEMTRNLIGRQVLLIL